MLGHKRPRQENLFSPRKKQTRIGKELDDLKQIISFDWLKEACKDKFSEKGRPSIAPEVFGAMLFLGFWYDIDSDRELCDECEDRRSFREFIGISDDDEIPVHSSLTHWRQRLGKEIFQQFLSHSIEAAINTGLKPGRCRLFDSTLVKAQADAGSSARVDIDPVRDANDYLEALGEWEEQKLPGESEVEEEAKPKKRDPKTKNNKRKLKNGKPISLNTNDLDAKLLSRPGKKTDFFHKAHFEFDASSALVMNADAGHVFEPVKMVQFLDVEKYAVDTAVGDTGYFSCEAEKWLQKRGICSHISVRDNSNNSGRAFGLDAFVYVEETDEFICPEGKTLTRQGTGSDGERCYASAQGSCVGCEMQAYCFRAGRPANRRKLTVGPDREFVEQARKRNRCNRYRRLMRRRSIICEGSFGTMKSHHGLRRARWIGEDAMAIQALMNGVVHNIKKALQLPVFASDMVVWILSCVVEALLGCRPRTNWAWGRQGRWGAKPSVPSVQNGFSEHSLFGTEGL